VNGLARPKVPETGRILAGRLAAAGGPSVRLILLYGSHLLKASPDRHSAYDLVVVVDDYGAFYGALKASGAIVRPAWLFRALARVLPPNAIAFAPNDGRDGIAKCLVVSTAHFERSLGARPRDHFLLGRMVQMVGLGWSAGEEQERWAREVIARAHAGVLDWMAPYLAGAFDAESLGRRMLEVCYRGEIRPEAANRSEKVFEPQQEHFRRALQPGIDAAVAAGTLTRDGERYRLSEPAGARRRLYWRWHFLRSKTRVTARWFKHVMTFDQWLPYITRKVERRTGRRVELTRLERRWPLIFLWPRVVRVLRNRPQREGGE
jgi:hypothetical protein